MSYWGVNYFLTFWLFASISIIYWYISTNMHLREIICHHKRCYGWRADLPRGNAIFTKVHWRPSSKPGEEIWKTTSCGCILYLPFRRLKLYAVGGYDGFSLLNSFERYDPLLQEWTSVSSMATSRCDMGVAVLFGDWNIVFTFEHASGVNS